MSSLVIISAIILFGCISAGAAAVGDKTADLKFTEERFDFGCVGVDFKILHTFKLVNEGTTTIHIDTVSGHCDCTEVRFVDSTLAPGDTADVKIIFSTANFYGPIDKNIRAHSSDAKVSSVQAYYSANVGQWLMKLEPKPVSVFFLPNQNVRTASIMNHALDKISVKDIYLESDIVDIKPVRSEAAKGESLDLELTPRAALEAGTHVSNLTMTIDLHQDVPPLRITIPVKVVRY